MNLRGASSTEHLKKLKVLKTKDIMITFLNGKVYDVWPEKRIYAVLETKKIHNLGFSIYLNGDNNHIEISANVYDIYGKQAELFETKFHDIRIQINSIEKQIDTFLKNMKLTRKDFYIGRLADCGD